MTNNPNALANLFKEFFNSERIGGLLLLACTLLSLFLANSSAGPGYTEFWHTKLDLSFGPMQLNYTIEHWINDGLMAIFFLLVGLEIERELYAGELKQLKNAITPIAAAIGGMAVPALIHFVFNNETATQNGVGIPMATDIAFALGMLALLGKNVPVGLKIFLTALAIIDDLGAVLFIAVFYSKGILWYYLLASLFIFLVLVFLGIRKVYNLVIYIIGGIIMWYCMLKSGIHSTIAGVLLAFAIPFGNNDEHSPSYRLQHFLHSIVAYFILPVFALANTALLFNESWLTDLQHSNSVGIIAGLLAGKPIGILLFTFLVIITRIGKLPENVNWTQLAGAGFLAGIGFTMSIFISNLAFTDSETIQSSKIAVLAGSLFSCLAGLLVLYFATRKAER